MAKHILLVLLAALVVQSVNAGTVNLLPMQPTAGSQLTVEYRPQAADMAWATKDASVHAVALWFGAESQFPTAMEVPLKSDGKRYTGQFTIPADAVFIMFKVGTGFAYDNNNEEYWSTLVYDANGRALSGANLRASQTCLGMMPPECRRKQDLEEATALLIQETKVSPKLLTPRVNLVMLESSTGAYSQTEGIAKLRQLVSPNTVPTNGEEAMAVAAAFRVIGDSIEAQRVMREATMKFQNSLITEQANLERLRTAGTLDDFVNMVISHLTDYPQSSARAGLIESVLQATTKQGSFRALIRFLDEVPNLPAVVYYQATNYMGAQDSLRSETMRLIENGITAAKNPKARLPYVGLSEWNAQQDLSLSQIYFVKGAILRSENKQQAAIAAFKESVRYGGKLTDKGVYEMLISTFDPKSNPDEVISYSEQAIQNGAHTAAIIENYKVALAQNGKDASTINDLVAKQKAMGAAALNSRLISEKLNQPMIDGTFTTLGGQPVNISDWKGKVVLIDYWATWCGPCRKSFPSLQKLYEKYKDNPNVVIAVVNVWERSEDRVVTVQDFLKQNPTLTFPMYLDKTDAVVQKYGVTGIPTKFILGKDGRIQFKEVGLAPDEQFIEETSKKIDLLLSE